MELNNSYFVAVISEVKKEYIVSGGIKKPLIKALCYDQNNKISEISIVFSEICQIKKSTSIGVGDVVFFSASIGECPKDNYVFYPNNLYLVRKCTMEFEDASRKFIESRLLPYAGEQNQVVFSGNVVSVSQNQVCIASKNNILVRGDIEEEYHIWVTNTQGNTDFINSKVVFVGGINEGRLSGMVFPLGIPSVATKREERKDA